MFDVEFKAECEFIRKVYSSFMHFDSIFDNLVDECVRVDVVGSYFLILPLFFRIAMNFEGKIDLSVGIKNGKIKAQHMRFIKFDRGVLGPTENW